MSIDQSVFPDKLKKAQVTPLYKKNDPLLKTNYRPVSVLCIFSKIFEKILEQQLSDFFKIFLILIYVLLEEVMDVRQPCSGY